MCVFVSPTCAKYVTWLLLPLAATTAQRGKEEGRRWPAGAGRHSEHKAETGPGDEGPAGEAGGDEERERQTCP